jgi:hypothetical protein
MWHRTYLHKFFRSAFPKIDQLLNPLFSELRLRVSIANCDLAFISPHSLSCPSNTQDRPTKSFSLSPHFAYSIHRRSLRKKFLQYHFKALNSWARKYGKNSSRLMRFYTYTRPSPSSFGSIGLHLLSQRIVSTVRTVDFVVPTRRHYKCIGLTYCPMSSKGRM